MFIEEAKKVIGEEQFFNFLSLYQQQHPKSQLVEQEVNRLEEEIIYFGGNTEGAIPKPLATDFANIKNAEEFQKASWIIVPSTY